MEEGGACYSNGEFMGRCVLSMSTYNPPTTIDIALVELTDVRPEHFFHVAPPAECDQDVTMCGVEGVPVQTVQRRGLLFNKNMREYTNIDGDLCYAVLTNKAWGLHRVLAVERIQKTFPIGAGDCGRLVASTTTHDGWYSVFGVLIGCLALQSDDGNDTPIEYFIAFPFKAALEEIKTTDMFCGKTLNIVGKKPRTSLGKSQNFARKKTLNILRK